MSDRAEPLLRVEDLHFTYPPRRAGAPARQVLHGVSLELHRGRTLAVIGETGSGKSTLARTVIQQPRPDSGRVVLAGQELTALRGRGLRQALSSVSMVFQDSYASLDPRWTVWNLIEEPLRGRGLSRAELRAKVRDLLDFVGLDPRVCESERPGRLSGGQCQRAAIARALAADPVLLIADEPVSALDVSVQAQIINLFLKIQDELDVAMLFISHDLGVVRHLSHDLLVLYGGHVCEAGDTDTVIATPHHPYTAGLLSTVPGSPWAERFLELRPKRDEGGFDPEAAGCWYRDRCPTADEACLVPPPLLPGDAASYACHHPVAGRAALRHPAQTREVHS